MDCSATGSLVRDDPVQMTTIQCSAKAGLYIQQGLSSGNIKYKHRILTTTKLDAWRFAYRLSNFTSVSGVFGLRKHVGPFACRKEIVALKGFDAAVVVCARAYRKLDGLFDFTVRVSSLNSSTAGFISHLDMWGLKFSGGMKFIQHYLKAMEWKP